MKCFLSFLYNADAWRVQQVRNMGAVEEQPILSANAWEEIRARGDAAIEDWIDKHMKGKQILIVLAGTHTAGRRWVKHEIRSAYAKGLGLLAVHIHNLQDSGGKQSSKGGNPFMGIVVNGKHVADSAKVVDPPYSTSKYVYDDIAENIGSWMKQAIALRR